jgi:hypothetical protein
MKEITLLKLSLRDFQGGTIIFDAKGKDVFIFGANAVGKTRLVSAFTWLLFSKDALGRADFEIKNLDTQGEAAHGLEHSVEAELSVGGEPVNLKKVFKEKWTKKRGNAEREFSGHTTEYFVDGVPLQEKLYIQKITDIAGDESKFRLLTSPSVFPALHWQKQRALLLEVCGDISDADVIASDEKLFPLAAILGKRTLEDHRKVVTARRSEINKEMERIPIRIDEVRRGIPDVTGIDRKASEKEAQALETALNDAKLRLQGVNTGGNVGVLTTKLSGLNADLRKMEDAHRSKSLSILNRLNQQISELQAQINSSCRHIFEINDDIKSKDKMLQSTDADLINLRNRWTAIDTEKFKDTISDTCPACDQPLPSERVQEAKEKAFAVFNDSKANHLEEINRVGKDLKEKRDRLSTEIENLNIELDGTKAKLLILNPQPKEITEERDILKSNSEDFSGIPHHSDLLDEIEDMESQIKAEREGKAQDIEKIQGEIREHQAHYGFAKAKIDRFLGREQGEKRIEELKQIEKVLSAEFEKLEGELYLSDLFVKTKVGLLTDRINSKFEFTRFKLFDVQVNGGISDCCEITVGGVGYNSGLNSSARTQAGCDIIRTLQQHFGMKAPVFVDNRESVSDLPKLNCQLISLVVSPEDKTLRIERR